MLNVVGRQNTRSRTWERRWKWDKGQANIASIKKQLMTYLDSCVCPAFKRWSINTVFFRSPRGLFFSSCFSIHRPWIAGVTCTMMIKWLVEQIGLVSALMAEPTHWNACLSNYCCPKAPSLLAHCWTAIQDWRAWRSCDRLPALFFQRVLCSLRK